MHNENHHLSYWSDYESGRYKFSSYEIFLDQDVNYIDRKYATIMTLVKEIGAIEHGFMFIFGLIISKW